MTFIRALSVVEKWADIDTTMYKLFFAIQNLSYFLKVLIKGYFKVRI